MEDSGDDFGAKGPLPSDLNESSLSLINTDSFKGILPSIMCFVKECLISPDASMRADTKPKARRNARPKGGHCEG